MNLLILLWSFTLSVVVVAITKETVAARALTKENSNLRSQEEEPIKSSYLYYKVAEEHFRAILKSNRNLQHVRRLDRPNRRLGHVCGDNEVRNGEFDSIGSRFDPATHNGQHWDGWSAMNSEMSVVSDGEGGYALLASNRDTSTWFTGLSTNLLDTGCLNEGDHIRIHARFKLLHESYPHCIPIAEEKERCPLVVLGKNYDDGSFHQEKLFDPSMNWSREDWNVYDKEYVLTGKDASSNVTNTYIVVVGGSGDLLLDDFSISLSQATEPQHVCIDECTSGEWLDSHSICLDAEQKYNRDYDECLAELDSFSYMDNFREYCESICVDHEVPRPFSE